MIRRNLWTGLNFSKRFSAVFYLAALLVFSLFLSFLFSSRVNAYGEYSVGLIHDMGSPSALDFSEYSTNNLGINASVILSQNNTYYNLSQYSDFANWNSSSRSGSIYKPNSWNFGNYDSDNIDIYVPVDGFGGSYNPLWKVPLTESSSGIYTSSDALKITCPDNNYYWGDSISLTNSHIESLGNTYDNTGNNANRYTSFNTSYSSSSVDGSTGRVGDPMYYQYQNVVYSNLSNNGTFITVYEVENNRSSSVYISSLGTSQYELDEFYALDSNGSDSTTSQWMLNGAVVGCSQTAVQNMLLSKDPAPEPVIPDDFPSSWDSLNNQNNEDAWDILNSMDPVDFQINSGSSGDILSLVLSFFSSFLEVETDKSHCGLYMPAFFGNRFSFGNNGGDNDFLYVNLCDNGFVNALSSDYNWIGVTSLKSVYNGNSWLYVGIKGLIYFFCFWLLIKILLGYVYWIYSLIDTTFGLVNDITDS